MHPTIELDLHQCDYCEQQVPSKLADWHMEKKHAHRLEKVTSDDVTNDDVTNEEVSPIRPTFDENLTQKEKEILDQSMDKSTDFPKIDLVNTVPETFIDDSLPSMIINDGVPVKCHVCDEDIMPQNLDKHVETYHTNGGLYCTFCQAPFKEKVEILLNTFLTKNSDGG